ncbi:hypothetical protein N7U66_00950 [Lacinutrix neustonica]|uniref:Lipoprotein n=1 Tax=Lacinutrix neustonica TaxID=2980107 RepID=A0A9E8MVG4_9FLAO|nr:hypothetical protein [Lacinutrix neustonica]WAC02347.1 hypothetical protein N7U66_00950 [Lacinutrix neustonica]
MMTYNIKIIFLCISTALMLSCSNEGVDVGNNTSSESSVEGNYFPSTVNDFRNYEVSNTTTLNMETTISSDSLYVVSQNGTTFMLEVNEGMPANGILCGILSSGTLTRSNSSLALNGSFSLPEEIASLFNFEIALNNLVLFDASAENNTVLSTTTNTISQDFNGLPVTITYLLSTTARGNFDNLMLNDAIYNTVTASQLALNLSVSTTISVGGFPITITLLEPQDILISTNYFADTIGLVQASSEIKYQISATAIAALEAAGQTLTIPASGSSTNIQNLTTFSVTE